MEGLSADEAEQYDRQIRLWGLEAQKRLRTSSVLVVGAKGLGAELCKNIVLAGVKSLTLLDHALVSPSDLGNRFLVSKDGESRAKQAVVQLQALNPNVDVLADTEPVGEKDDTFFTQFSAVCVSCSSLPFLLHINNVCRTHGIKFFCGDVWGFYGYFLSDLGEHEYSMEEVSEYRVGDETQAVAPVQDGEKKSVKKSCSFPALQEALAANWSSKPARYFKRTPPTWFIIRTLQEFRDSNGGRDPQEEGDREGLLSAQAAAAAKLGINPDLIPNHFYRFCNGDLSPVCAIVSGVMGQEVIKALSGKDEPYQNCFLYDGVNSTGIVEYIGP
jgi:ubiquitin-like 1-activating enzyme E1 A